MSHVLPDKTADISFVDFANKPANFGDSEEDQFDVKFPFGGDDGGANMHTNDTTTPQIRIKVQDSVKVVAVRRTSGANKQRQAIMMARFWVDVVSISDEGMITGTTSAHLPHFNFQGMDPDDSLGARVGNNELLVLRSTQVLGVVHGKQWKK